MSSCPPLIKALSFIVMKIISSLYLFILMAVIGEGLLAQGLTLTNGRKTKVFETGSFVEVKSAAGCNPNILDDCVGNFDWFLGEIMSVGEDSVVFKVYLSHKIRYMNGASIKMDKLEFEEGIHVVVSKDRLDWICKSVPPEDQLNRRALLLGGSVFILHGLSEFLSSWVLEQKTLNETEVAVFTGEIILGSLILALSKRKKYYLSPLLKGRRIRSVWNVQ